MPLIRAAHEGTEVVMSILLLSRPGLAALGFCLLSASLALDLVSAQARTIDIGVTSAVRPNATGTPPELQTRVLQVGLDLFSNERIDTGPNGQAHLLFRDGSALTVGPNSSLALDTFVYDPQAKSGELIVSASKGLFRFVGGRISKTKPVVFNTPTAIIGIRGGVALMEVNAAGTQGSAPLVPVSVTMVYGDEVTLETPGGGAPQRMTRAGFTMQQSADGSIGTPTPATQQQLNSALIRLEEPQDQDDEAGALGDIAPAGGGPAVSDEDVSNSQMSSLGSGNNPSNLSPTSLPSAPPTTVPVQSDVVTAAQQTATDEALEEELEGQGGNSSSQTLTGASVGPTTLAVAGRVKGGNNVAFGSNDTDPEDNFAISDTSLGSTLNIVSEEGSQVSLPVQSGTFVFGSEDVSLTGLVAEEIELLSAVGVLNSGGDFVYYNLVEFDAVDGVFRDLIFAGVPTPVSAFPTSGVTAYTFAPDFLLFDTRVPFISPIYLNAPNAPNFLAPSSPPMAYIYWNGNGSGTPRPFYSSTIVINGRGSDQVSVASVMAGRVGLTSNGKPFIRGYMRGSSHVQPGAASGVTEFQSGGFASANNPLGGDFFGLSGPNHFVLEGHTVNSEDVATAIGIQANSGIATPVTYFPNVVASRTSANAVGTMRGSGVLNGFTAGFTQNYNSGNDFDRHAFNLTPEDPTSDFVLTRNPNTNTVGVSMDLGRFGPDDTFRTINLGDHDGSTGRSAYIDDHRFAMIEPVSPNDPSTALDPVSERAYLVTHDQVHLQGVQESGESICECAYTTWGFWGLRMVFNDGVGALDGNRIEAHLMPFVAGQIANTAQLSPLSPITATYNGTVIGTVVNGGLGNMSADVYKETANISMTFTVSAGTANMVSGQITNFDGGSLAMSNFNNSGVHYTAQLNGTARGNTVGGFMQGVFVGPGTPPANTIGQGGFNNDGSSYSARFVYFAEN